MAKHEMTRHRRTGRWMSVGALAGMLAILAACGSSSPQLTFDGNGCDYKGSSALSVGSVDLTFHNDSDQYAGLAVFELPSDEAARSAELALVGTDFQIPTDPDPNAGQMMGTLLADPGQELTQNVPLPAGEFVIDCATLSSGGQPLHAWRAASLEVKP